MDVRSGTRLISSPYFYPADGFNPRIFFGGRGVGLGILWVGLFLFLGEGRKDFLFAACVCGF